MFSPISSTGIFADSQTTPFTPYPLRYGPANRTWRAFRQTSCEDSPNPQHPLVRLSFEAPLLPADKIDKILRWSQVDNLHEVNTSEPRSSRVLHMGDSRMIYNKPIEHRHEYWIRRADPRLIQLDDQHQTHLVGDRWQIYSHNSVMIFGDL